MVRLLFALTLAAAMLFAPLAMAGGAAMAEAPAAGDHHAQMQADGRCGDQPAKEQGKAEDGACCVAACTGLALEPATSIEPQRLSASARRPSPDQHRRGFLAELPTPPPRLA